VTNTSTTIYFNWSAVLSGDRFSGQPGNMENMENISRSGLRRSAPPANTRLSGDTITIGPDQEERKGRGGEEHVVSPRRDPFHNVVGLSAAETSDFRARMEINAARLSPQRFTMRTFHGGQLKCSLSLSALEQFKQVFVVMELTGKKL